MSVYACVRLYMALSPSLLVCDSALISFTMRWFTSNYPLRVRVWIFIIFQWTFFIIKTVISSFFQEPSAVAVQRGRSSYIVSKFMVLKYCTAHLTVSTLINSAHMYSQKHKHIVENLCIDTLEID